MMDFIMVPLTTGIVFAAIYGLFELFVRRKERLAIIEKIGEKLDASAFEGKMRLPSYGRDALLVQFLEGRLSVGGDRFGSAGRFLLEYYGGRWWIV